MHVLPKQIIVLICKISLVQHRWRLNSNFKKTKIWSEECETFELSYWMGLGIHALLATADDFFSPTKQWNWYGITFHFLPWMWGTPIMPLHCARAAPTRSLRRGGRTSATCLEGDENLMEGHEWSVPKVISHQLCSSSYKNLRLNNFLFSEIYRILSHVLQHSSKQFSASRKATMHFSKLIPIPSDSLDSINNWNIFSQQLTEN